MADQITVSSTANPYQAGVYSAGSNSKNTMDVNSFIKLLAAQLSNQDMTSPMDNSEMMSQMTNMAMVQSLTAMTESLNTSAAVTTQTYAGSLIGQEITVAVTDPDTGAANGVKYGKVISVDFTQGDPVVRLEVYNGIEQYHVPYKAYLSNSLTGKKLEISGTLSSKRPFNYLIIPIAITDEDK